MTRVELENFYRVYKQSRNKNALVSEDDLKQKLWKLYFNNIKNIKNNENYI